MKIQIGKTILNRTFKYLKSCLNEYGEVFSSKVSNVFKVAYGIGDFALINSGLKYEQHLFILVDVTSSGREFYRFVDWIKSQSYYADDYAYDDIEDGRLHMFVIRLPDKFQGIIEKFKLGQYSQMYTTADLDFLFKDYPQYRRTLIKDHQYAVEFVNKINETYNTNVTYSEWEGEVDFPPIEEEENFNAQI